MIQKTDINSDVLQLIKAPLKEFFYLGNLALLERKKIAIVGSRRPNQYARDMTRILAQKLSDAGCVIVSGGAIGVDAIAHKSAGAKNTIMVAATGLDKRYPAINKNLIASIEQEGLVLSQFQQGTPSKKYNFVLRNEIIVALGEILIVTYADLNSGTMRSIEYAQKMKKKIYVLPHRIGESSATNRLLLKKEAEAIYDIDAFVSCFAVEDISQEKKSLYGESFYEYCKKSPSYEEAVRKFPTQIFEAELAGVVRVERGRVILV